MEALANAMVVIIFQYISVSNLYLNLYNVTCQLYLGKAGKKTE